MSRRHASGAESAKGLLLTVLGELVLPAERASWTATFIEVLGRLGVEEGAVRQALSRMAADGWLRSERVGRRTLWRLSVSGERLLVEGTERIYGFTGPASDWDGRWLLVLARVPETDRAARHLLRTRLSWAGLGSPAPGVWIGTRTDRLVEVEEVLRRAGVFDDAEAFIAEHRGHTRLEAMVANAWDLEAIEHEYARFVAEFSSPLTEQPLARLIELVHAWRRFPSMDPGLPRELLPSGWSGTQAACLFRSRHAEWSVRATAEWERLRAASPDPRATR